MTIIERILETLEINGLKMSELCQYIGIGTSTMANWKTRNTDPPAKYIIPICEFLNVSLHYILIGKSDSKLELSEEETKVIKYYYRLTEEQKDYIKGEMVRLNMVEPQNKLDVEFAKELAK